MGLSGDADETKAAKPAKADGFDLKGFASPNADAEDPPLFPTFQGFSELPVTGQDCVEDDTPLYPETFDDFTDLPVTDVATKSFREEPPHLPFGFDDFSEIPVNGEDSCEEESRQLTKGVDSPKRTLLVMPGDESEENETSVKRAKIELEGGQTIKADMYYEEGTGGAFQEWKADDLQDQDKENASYSVKPASSTEANNIELIEMQPVLDSPLERSRLLNAALRRGWSRLSKREKSMDKREKSMDKREKSMDKREETIDKREGSFDKRDATAVGSPDAEPVTEPSVNPSSPDKSPTAKKVKDSVVEKIQKTKAMVEKLDSNTSLVEKITSIPTRTKGLLQSYKSNKNISSEFIQEQGKLISKKLKAYAGSVTAAGILDALINTVMEQDGASDDAVGTEQDMASDDAVGTKQDGDSDEQDMTSDDAAGTKQDGASDDTVGTEPADAVGKEQVGATDAVGKEQVGATDPVKKDNVD